MRAIPRIRKLLKKHGQVVIPKKDYVALLNSHYAHEQIARVEQLEALCRRLAQQIGRLGSAVIPVAGTRPFSAHLQELRNDLSDASYHFVLARIAEEERNAE